MALTVISFNRTARNLFYDDFSYAAFPGSGWTVGAGNTIDTVQYHEAANSVASKTTNSLGRYVTASGSSMYAFGVMYSWGGNVGYFNIDGTTVVFSSGNSPWAAYGGVKTGLTSGTAYWCYFANNGTGTYVNVDELIFGTAEIVINGLLDGQKFKIYKNGSLIRTSAASAGGVCTLALVSADIASMPYDQLQITDVDGSTVLSGNGVQNFDDSKIYNGLLGGDVYQAIVSSAKIPPLKPINPLSAVCEIFMLTSNRKCYKAFVKPGMISPPTWGTRGTFNLTIVDNTGTEINNLKRGTRVWIYGKLGIRYKRLFAGILNQPIVDKLPSNQRKIKLTGVSMGGYMDIHGYPNVTYMSSLTAQDFFTNSTFGIKQYVPEFDFGNGIYAPTKTVSYLTELPCKQISAAVDELGDLVSTPQERWKWMDCTGEHLGERRPDIHFAPVSKTPGLVPIVAARCFRYQMPVDETSIITNYQVHYTYNYSWDVNDMKSAYSALTYAVQVTGANACLSYDLTNVTDYTVQAGDYLEYDIYTMNKYSRPFFDLCSGATALRDAGVRDSWGIEASGVSLEHIALDRWYSRRIALPTGWVGMGISRYEVAEDSQTPGTYRNGFRNVRITDGNETTRKSIWEGASGWTTGVSRVTGAALVTLAGEDPVYRLRPKAVDLPWMTAGQAQAYTQLVVNDFGDRAKFVQAWFPLDCRMSSGEYPLLVEKGGQGRMEMSDLTFVLDDPPRTEVRLTA